MRSNLEEKVWYRFYKVFAGIVVILSFFSPLFIRLNLSNSFWYVDGIINVVMWTFLFWILKRIIVYILYGNNYSATPIDQINQLETKDKKKFNLEESWGFAVGLLAVFGVAGFFLDRTSIKSFIWGLVGGFIVLIFIYFVHSAIKDKK